MNGIKERKSGWWMRQKEDVEIINEILEEKKRKQTMAQRH